MGQSKTGDAQEKPGEDFSWEGGVWRGQARVRSKPRWWPAKGLFFSKYTFDLFNFCERSVVNVLYCRRLVLLTLLWMFGLTYLAAWFYLVVWFYVLCCLVLLGCLVLRTWLFDSTWSFGFTWSYIVGCLVLRIWLWMI